MSVRLSAPASLLLALLSVACAPAGSPHPVPGSAASINETETGGFIRLSQESKAVSIGIEASAARVWSVLPAVYGRLGIAAEVREEASRTIGTRGFTQQRLDGRRTGDWVTCGNQGSGPGMGGRYRTRLSIISTVRQRSDGGSDLLTEVGGSAAPVEGTSTGAVACASTGGIEQRIRALVQEELAR